MNRFWWVRHGPTHAKDMVGWSDLPADLSDTAMLGRLSDFLPHNAPVVSSDLLRASATADAVCGNRARLPHEPGLREINFGDWELCQFAEIEKDDPDRIRAYYESPGDVRPPGGESWVETCDRVNAAVDRLVVVGLSDIIVVAHFGSILTQVQRASGMTAYQAFGHRIDNLSVTQIVFDGLWRAGPINQIL